MRNQRHRGSEDYKSVELGNETRLVLDMPIVNIIIIIVITIIIIITNQLSWAMRLR